MKRIFAVLFSLFFCFAVTFAQTEEEEIPKGLSIGPYFGWSVAGINASEVPNGTKNSVETAPSPNFGIMGYYPTDYTKNSGFGGMLGFKQIPYGFNKGEQKTGFTFSYFIIGAFFNISGFTIGLDASFPSSGKIIDSDVELNTDNAATCVDLKLGGFFKVQESKFGSLNVFLNGGYFLSDQYNNSTSYKVNPAHAEIGLSYLLNTTDW
jgi:hypothetical protein